MSVRDIDGSNAESFDERDERLEAEEFEDYSNDIETDEYLDDYYSDEEPTEEPEQAPAPVTLRSRVTPLFIATVVLALLALTVQTCLEVRCNHEGHSFIYCTLTN